MPLPRYAQTGSTFGTYKRQRKRAGQPVSEVEEAEIQAAFWDILKATAPEEYQAALDQLPQVVDQEPLTSHNQSLVVKQTLFQAWTNDH